MARKRESSQEALVAFEMLCDRLSVVSEVSRARWFGLPAARVSGTMFAALHGESLVVKLGADEVDRHITAGEGERFDPAGNGRAMRDWLETSLPPQDWPRLGGAALAFACLQP